MKRNLLLDGVDMIFVALFMLLAAQFMLPSLGIGLWMVIAPILLLIDIDYVIGYFIGNVVAGVMVGFYFSFILKLKGKDK